MKKVRKVLALLVSIITLLTSLGINSLAATAPASISVIINEQSVDFKNAKPVMMNNRVYVPLRTFFEVLGATVTYDDATQTITAVRGEKTVIMTIGSKKMKRTNQGFDTSQTMDAAPYIDGDYTMIPARYAASAFGCTIGWDDKTQTVLILDVYGLIKSSGAHYTLMNKYLKTGRISNNTRAFDGTMYNLRTGVTASESYTVSATFSGIENLNSSNVNVKFDYGSFFNYLYSASTLTAAESALLSKYQNIDYKYIYNRNTVRIYCQSPQLNELYNIESDAWILTTASKYFSLSSFAPRDSNVPNPFYESSVEEFIALKMLVKTFSTREALQSAVEYFKLINSYFNDENFTKDGDVYTKILHTESNRIVTDFSFQITVQNDQAIAYTLTRKVGSSSDSNEYFSSMDASGYLVVRSTYSTLNTKRESYLGVKIMNTNNTPLSKPASGKIYEEKSLKAAS